SRGMTIAPPIRPVRFVLVVATVLVLVASLLSLPGSGACRNGGLANHTRSTVKNTELAIEHFRCAADAPPRAMTQLVQQRYLVSVPRDSWNRKLRLQCPISHGRRGCDIRSAGRYGQFGNGVHITS